ncbi:hypothetical protein ZOSMA_185G00670, partial [Zostera marina]
ALAALGLKVGGTVKQRADRLFLTKEISEINKGNRAKQTSHSLGSKSLAQRNYEAEQKGLNDIET